MIKSITGILVVAVLGGCAVQSTSKYAANQRENIAVTQDQLRLRVRSLVNPMCGQIEATADSIIARTSDRKLQLAALTWEIEGVPMMREALFQPDAITASVDALTLCYQMRDYFEKGPGKESLGEASAAAAETYRRLGEQVEKTMASATASGDAPKAKEFATKWASEHPIRGSIGERESIIAWLTIYQNTEGISAGESIAEVSTTLDDVNRKLDVYSDQLIRQTRWEVQRFKLETMSELKLEEAIPLAERAMSEMDRLAPQMERSMEVAQETPKLVTSERQAAIAAIHDEMAHTLQFIHEERLAALESVSQQRSIAIANLGAAISEERKQAAIDADRIAGNRIDYAIRQVRWLLVVGGGVALVVAVASVLLLRRFPARRVR